MARRLTYIVGLESTMSRVNREIMAIRTRTHRGLHEALDFLYEDMQVTSPTVPEKTGELLGSWFKKQKGTIKKISMEAGFSAPYAIYVHEMTEENYGHPINWTKPGSGAKFLQFGLDRNVQKMTMIVAKRAKGRL